MVTLRRLRKPMPWVTWTILVDPGIAVKMHEEIILQKRTKTEVLNEAFLLYLEHMKKEHRQEAKLRKEGEENG